MKNAFKKSLALLAFIAIIALAFTGCKKDSSSSSSGNGGGGGNVPTRNYGSLTVAGQSYDIVLGILDSHYDEELQTWFVYLIFEDRLDAQTANAFSTDFQIDVAFPTGTFNYVSSLVKPNDNCTGIFRSGNNVLYCQSGTITITGTPDNCTVTASGSASPYDNSFETNFSVQFEGPLVQSY